MDNSNNPNSPNNSNPSDSATGTIPPAANLNQSFPPTSSPISSVPSDSAFPPSDTTSPLPSANPLGTAPINPSSIWPTSDTSSLGKPPQPAAPTPEPLGPPVSSAVPDLNPTGQTAYPSPSSPSTWPPLSQTPPDTILNPPPGPTPSPLDNPWGTPTQPPVNGSPPQAPSTWPSVNTLATQPTPPPTSEPPPPLPTSVPETPAEAIPTDLSHLITNSQPEENQPPPVNQPETLVVPPATGALPEIPSIPTENAHKGIPKWAIGVAVGLLVVVVGASAYFILGIGQAPKTGSVPANQLSKPPQQPAKSPVVAATPVPQSTPIPSAPVATGSASFGQLGGAAPTPQATSAADLLRQRQQGN